jgi:hypothetical protein
MSFILKQIRSKQYKTIWVAGKWTSLEIIKLNQISQTEKYKHHMFSLICGIQILKMNDSNVKPGLLGCGDQWESERRL